MQHKEAMVVLAETHLVLAAEEVPVKQEGMVLHNQVHQQPEEREVMVLLRLYQVPL
jgi:hypothetical protein